MLFLKGMSKMINKQRDLEVRPILKFTQIPHQENFCPWDPALRESGIPLKYGIHSKKAEIWNPGHEILKT